MNSLIAVSLAILCLSASLAKAAPSTTTTELSAGQPTSTESAAATTTQSATGAPADQSTPDPNQTASMAVSASHDKHDIGQMLPTSSFTCAGREIGYYADTERDCKVYHFCLLGDYNGEAVYQRISYLCLNETVFDQQALDCVESGKLQSPCKDSPTYYTASNKVLRTAILGKVKQESSEAAKPTSTTPAPSTPSS